MRSNNQSTTLPAELQELDNSLSNIEKATMDTIRTSINSIENEPTKEKELISLWGNHAINICNFFFEECERTDNKGLYKNIIKYMKSNK